MSSKESRTAFVKDGRFGSYPPRI